jgi:hypothetical protein
MKTKMSGASFAIIFALILTGCATVKTREDVDAFPLKAKGQVDQMSRQRFIDCVTDGFRKSHGAYANVITAQEQRADVLRVENYAGGRILLISVDIFADGKTELFESTSAALINTDAEIGAFKACLIKFGKTS